MFRAIVVLLALWLGTHAVRAQPAPQGGEAGLAQAYFLDKEYAEALPLFRQLHARDPDADIYVQRVVDCLVQLKQVPEAEDFLQKLARRRSDRPQYMVLLGVLYEQTGRPAEAQAVYAGLVERSRSPQELQAVGRALTASRRYEPAVTAYLKARTVVGIPTEFAQELAQCYRYLGKIGEATTEWLNLYKRQNGHFPIIQRELMRLVQPGNGGLVEDALLKAIQENERDPNLRELLYQFYIRTENYDQAILMARSLDRLRREDGRRLFQLALTLQQSQQYDLSNKALDILTVTHEDSPLLLNAYFERAKNYELKAFQRRPLDTASVRQALANYESLFEQFGRRTRFADAMLRKARLHVFYLNQLDQAIAELRLIEELPIQPKERAQAQLLLGDIYVMQGNIAKARLKYTEVEEAMPDAQEGADAKFRGAKLAFYQGNFELAQARLRTLKDNTSDNISNDAISLFLTIQENTGLDSTPVALQHFARAQLWMYQQQYAKALGVLDSILAVYPNHPITDNALWEKAQVMLAWNRVHDAIPLLDRILKGFPADILADDALFLKAELTERNLNDLAAAQELYLQLLADYPSSLYKVEARRRIRQLRGEKDAGA